jgi:precorrin-4 methylase
MPIIAYICECNNIVKKFYRLAKDSPIVFTCDKCKKDMKKMLSSPSSVSKIVVDNGVQARAVEIVPNIVELNQERASKNYKGD